jgi:uncharacterized phiE125 gp8 family phage protein
MALTLVTAPAAEPLSATEAKDHLREDGTGQDSLITSLIVAARQYGETVTRRAWVTQTWDLKLDGFPACGVIDVPLPPLQSVTSVTYLDESGVSQTLSAGSYTVDIAGEPGRIVRAYGAAWPTTRYGTPSAVTVRFVAGYGLAVAVPDVLKHAMRLMIGHWYANRENVALGTIATEVPFAADALLQTRRIMRIA